MKKSNFRLVLFLCLYLLLLFSLSFNYLRLGSTPGPDSLQIDFFSENLIETGRLKYCFDEINLIFGTRGMLNDLEGCKTHGSMHGYIIIISLLKLVSVYIVPIATYFFALLSLIFFYKIANLFYDKKTSLIGTILLSLLTPFFLYSNTDYNNLSFLSFLFLGSYYFLRTRDSNNLGNFILCGLFLGCAFLIRYPDILFAIPFIVFFKIDTLKNKFKKYVLSAVIFSLFLLIIFVINIDVFGSPLGFLTAKQLGLGTNFFPDRPDKAIPLFSFINFNIAFKNILSYILIVFPAYILIFFGSLKNNRKFLVFSIISLCILVVVYFGGIWSGYGSDPSLGHPYARYALPFYSFFLLSSLKFLRSYDKKVIISVVCLGLLFTLSLSLSGESGIFDFKKSHETYQQTKTNFIKNIDKDSIVFTKYNDKYLFPDVTTAIYTSYDEQNRINDTVNLIINLKKDGAEIYFLQEDWATMQDKYLFSDYIFELEKRGFVTEKITNTIYKITLQNKTNTTTQTLKNATT